MPAGYDDYRAYRAEWHATPSTPPVVSTTPNADGTLGVHAIWNGATEVARWYVVGGARRDSLWPLGETKWNGFDTAIALSAPAAYVAVVAVDERGRFIGRSEPIATVSTASP